MLKRLLSLVLAALIAVPAPALPAQVAPPSIERPVAHAARDAAPALPRLAQRLSDTIPPLYMLGGDDKIAPVALWNAATDAFPSTVLSHSRTSLATMFDSTGKLTYAPNNLLTYSNTFSDASWSKYNLSVASGAADPLGGTDAFTVTATGPGAQLYKITFFSSAKSVNFLTSIWVKRRTGTGAISLYTPANNAPSTIPVDGSWQRFSSTSVGYTTDDRFYVVLEIGLIGDAVDVYMAVGSAVTYETSPRTADQVITTSAAYYGPRIDYDPNTLAVKGLLIEEARTNYLVAGNDLTNAAWTGGTRAAGVATGIDGLTSMNRATMAAGSTQVYQTVTQAAGNYAGAAYFKAETGATWIYLQLSDGPGNGYRVWFNLSTGAIGSNTTIGTGQSGLTSSVTPVGNGIYRFNVNGNIPNSTKQLLFAAVRADGSVSTTANDTVLFNYGTLEPGTFPTSPIATAASSVTRAADVVQFTGAALTALQGSAGSAIVQTSDAANSGGVSSAIIGSNAIANMYLRFVGASLSSLSSDVTSLTAPGTTNLTSASRSAVAWGASSRSIVQNGSTVGTDAKTFSGASAAYLGVANGGISYWLNGHIASFAIYNQRLPDATLQAKSVVGASYAASDNVNPFAPQFAANDNLPVHWRIAL